MAKGFCAAYTQNMYSGKPGELLQTQTKSHLLVWILLIALGAVSPFSAKAELFTGLTVDHDGTERLYDLFVPEDTGSQPMPLVLDLHGFSFNRVHQRGSSGFDDLAEEEGFLVAYPDGIDSRWNAEFGLSGTDDVGFLRALVADVSTMQNVALNRIYATGWSQGGMMAYRLACEASDMIAAIAPVAGGVVEGSEGRCEPDREVPVVSFRGDTDAVVPYGGGLVFAITPAPIVLSADDTFLFSRQLNSCSGPVERTSLGDTSFCDSDPGCPEDGQVSSCTVRGSFGPNFHQIYFNRDNLDLARHSWDFLKLHSLSDSVPDFEINAGLNGNWWNGPARSGEGVQVEIADGGDGTMILVATIYSYDGIGNQIFMIAVGTVNGDTVEVDVFITNGGIWGDNYDPALVIETQWGTGTFTANSCDTIHMILVPNDTFQGMGYTNLEYDLIRLTTSATACPIGNPN